MLKYLIKHVKHGYATLDVGNKQWCYGIRDVAYRFDDLVTAASTAKLLSPECFVEPVESKLQYRLAHLLCLMGFTDAGGKVPGKGEFQISGDDLVLYQVIFRFDIHGGFREIVV